jgi:hypothetical protein
MQRGNSFHEAENSNENELEKAQSEKNRPIVQSACEMTREKSERLILNPTGMQREKFLF